MLASDVGGGEYVITRDRLVARVPTPRAIRCPICGTDNAVVVPSYSIANVVETGNGRQNGSSMIVHGTVNQYTFTGAGRESVA